MKKKETILKNYLENVPQKLSINYNVDKDGIVTLEVENKGFANKLAQKLLKKPKISYIHLDEFGSFIWQKIDGQKTIQDIGEDVWKNFGDKANPLYGRLAKYFQILSSYGFVDFNKHI